MRLTRFDRPIVCLTLTIATLMTLPGRAAAGDDAGIKPSDPAANDGKQHGNASFYSRHLTGQKTASGERYDPKALTAAHRTLPLGTQVKVVNPKNDRSVVVTVNDRGPLTKSRVIDLSGAAADELGMRKSGVTKVETQVVGSSTSRSASAEQSAPR